MDISFYKAQSLSCGRTVVWEDMLPTSPERLACLLLARQVAVGGDRLLVIREGLDVPTTYLWCYAEDGQTLALTEEDIRCAAACLFFRGKKERHLQFLTDDGTRTAEVFCQKGSAAEVLTYLPPPDMGSAALGLHSTSPLLGRLLSVLGFSYPVYTVGIGGRVFAVVFEYGTTLDRLRVSEVGVALSIHPVFRVSPTVVFVSHASCRRLFLRLWEPSFGEVPASAEAAAAAFAVSCLRGFSSIGSENIIRMRGGDVRITAAALLGEMKVTAPAAFCFEGRLSLDLLSGESS